MAQNNHGSNWIEEDVAQAVETLEGYLTLAEHHGIEKVLLEVSKYTRRDLAITPKVLAKVLG